MPEANRPLLKRIICAIIGHKLVPTGRRAYILMEFHCRRCGTLLINNMHSGYLGSVFPRGRTSDGELLTVFQSDADWEEILSDAKRYCSSSRATVSHDLPIPNEKQADGVNDPRGGLRMLHALKLIKLEALSCTDDPPRSLARIIQLCMDAGVTEHFEELEDFKRSGILNAVFTPLDRNRKPD